MALMGYGLCNQQLGLCLSFVLKYICMKTSEGLPWDSYIPKDWYI